MAAHERPVRDPRQRGDAAADPGRARDPALARLARALARSGVAGGRVARRRDPRVAGPRLQPARAQPSPCRLRDRSRRLARRPHGAPRRRPVHRGRDPEPGIRRPRASGRHERRAHPGADGPLVRPRGAPGAVRPRLDGVPRTGAAVRGLSSSRRMPVARAPLRAAAEAVRFEGSFRQRRAALLRLVAEEPAPLEALDREAVDSLVRDGLVECDGELVRLPA